MPTIKYYLRVGLLPPGTTTAPNQATYDDEHLRRLRLIRVFVDIAGLTVTATRAIFAAIEDPQTSGEDLFAVIEGAPSRARRRALDGAARDAAVEEVARRLADQRWWVQRDGRALDRLAEARVTARLLELHELDAALDTYAGAATELARCDVAVARTLADRLARVPRDRAGALAEAVAVVLLSDAMFEALHSLARADGLTRLLAEWLPVVDRPGGVRTTQAAPDTPGRAGFREPADERPTSTTGSR